MRSYHFDHRWRRDLAAWSTVPEGLRANLIALTMSTRDLELNVGRHTATVLQRLPDKIIDLVEMDKSTVGNLPDIGLASLRKIEGGLGFIEVWEGEGHHEFSGVASLALGMDLTTYIPHLLKIGFLQERA